ncbi:hypothetical protein RM545_08705 [Zunongwangia sp. F260]|uniref:Uncharacterized protein n=1 Tax=Autumnicola lenta TaxID=3075593 RepID=A0ABU3CKL0_9FLAO|nr:hypothetical protein [Zunongwangia sp. F260]MDT0646768.1 hypothetical protein [Zunongwangia sp. F260]
MKLRLLFSGVFIIINCLSSLGQDIVVDDISSADKRNSKIIREIQVHAEKIISPFVSNNIYIAQVGEGNSSYVNMTAEDSNLNLNQEGSYNTIHLEAHVRSMEGTVTQNGNSNFVLNLASDPNLDVPINVRQNGNNLNFESYGVNSIGSKLMFQMTGDANSIIVRNFN